MGSATSLGGILFSARIQYSWRTRIWKKNSAINRVEVLLILYVIYLPTVVFTKIYHSYYNFYNQFTRTIDNQKQLSIQTDKNAWYCHVNFNQGLFQIDLYHIDCNKCWDAIQFISPKCKALCKNINVLMSQLLLFRLQRRRNVVPRKCIWSTHKAPSFMHQLRLQ